MLYINTVGAESILELQSSSEPHIDQILLRHGCQFVSGYSQWKNRGPRRQLAIFRRLPDLALGVSSYPAFYSTAKLIT